MRASRMLSSGGSLTCARPLAAWQLPRSLFAMTLQFAFLDRRFSDRVRQDGIFAQKYGL